MWHFKEFKNENHLIIFVYFMCVNHSTLVSRIPLNTTKSTFKILF